MAESIKDYSSIDVNVSEIPNGTCRVSEQLTAEHKDALPANVRSGLEVAGRPPTPQHAGPAPRRLGCQAGLRASCARQTPAGRQDEAALARARTRPAPPAMRRRRAMGHHTVTTADDPGWDGCSDTHRPDGRTSEPSRVTAGWETNEFRRTRSSLAPANTLRLKQVAPAICVREIYNVVAKPILPNTSFVKKSVSGKNKLKCLPSSLPS